MSNQIVISSGAKVRSLEGVLTGTAGIVNSVPLGGANGVATLDALGKVPLSQLPASVVTYLGTWNAATNTPTLTNGVGDVGDLYICNVAGTVNFGAGPITFAVGDWVIYSGTEWQKSSGASGTVTSVAVTESGDALTITGSPITTSGTINIGFAGTGSQYIKGDGTLATFPTTIDQAKRLITEVYNSTGATLSKGTVVYINGGQGNLPTITKAQANADNTSAQTYGVVQSDITNMNNGFVVVFGSLTDLDTQAYAVGTQLYLSGTTAGAWTSTKPSAPIHLVYVGIVVRSHPTQGVVEIRIQNGYELEELHDVAISSPVNNQGIFYNSSNDLWENKSIATALGYTPANDALVVHLAGTETISGLKNFDAAINLKVGSGAGGTGYIGLGSITNNTLVVYNTTSGTTYSQSLAFPTTSAQTYTFPAINGTVTLLEGTQTFTGDKTFSTAIKADSSILLKNGIQSILSGYVNIAGNTFGKGIDISYYDTAGTSPLTQVLNFSPTSSYTYTFPASSGTIALTSNLSSYLPLSGGTLTGALNGTSITLTNDIYLENNKFLYAKKFSGATAFSLIGITPSDKVLIDGSGMGVNFGGTIGNGTYTYTLPSATGTLALASDLSSYVPYTGATADVNLGTTYSLSANNITAAGVVKSDFGLQLKSGLTTTISGYLSISAQKVSTNSQLNVYTDTGFYFSLIAPNTANYSYTFPASSGTLALTSDLGNYVTLATTQTITGAKTFSASLNGAAATFTSLQVNGAQTISNAGSGDYLTIQNTDPSIGGGETVSLVLDYTQAASSTGWKILSRYAGGNLQFVPNKNNAGYNTYALSLDGTSGAATFSSATMNIGTSTSRGNVTIEQTTTNAGLVINSAIAEPPKLYLRDGGGAGYSELQANNNLYLNASKVGIGTNSPGYKLTINDTITSGRAIQAVQSATSGTNYGAVLVAEGSGATKNIGLYASAEGATTNVAAIFDKGNVGIGTSSPSGKLHVKGNILIERSSIAESSELTMENGEFDIKASPYNYNMRFFTGTGGTSTERMRISKDGALFLGVTSGDAGYIMQLPNSSGNKAKAYAWDTYSDERIKKKITSIIYGLNEILKLNPVSYNQYDSETINNKIILKDTYKENIGFIAQETYDIIPEVVNKGKEEYELWGMDYSRLIPVLVKAIQEQNEIITKQGQAIEELKALIAAK